MKRRSFIMENCKSLRSVIRLLHIIKHRAIGSRIIIIDIVHSPVIKKIVSWSHVLYMGRYGAMCQMSRVGPWARASRRTIGQLGGHVRLIAPGKACCESDTTYNLLLWSCKFSVRLAQHL